MRATSRSKEEYAPSILQDDETRCFLCGRTDRKLDRHEVFGGPYRKKSKRYGLWVSLCHEDCHEGKRGAQYNAEVNHELRSYAQEVAMMVYGWTTDDFRAIFGKNWCDDG